ncbi:MAG: translocation/assembly module TamB domain-containing protein [Thermoanaerobaculia bacterium]|nr:translocation/assembly module TamB domain-containing protein [Thermoanaerobaculia bacterium]
MTDAEDTAERCRTGRRRRPGRLRRWLVRPVLWSLALAAVALFLLQLWTDSPRGREWARGMIESELRARLDHPVSVGRVSFVLMPFRLEAWDVRIAGGPAPDPSGGGAAAGASAQRPDPSATTPEPFLLVPHALVDLDLLSLRRGRAEVQRLRLERPEIHLEWYEPAGDNLVKRNPARPRREGPWELWIDRVEVDKARVFVDHDRVEISVTADTVRTRLHGRGPMLLFGQTVAQDVEVRLPNARPIRASVAASGSIRRGRLDVESARIRRPGVAADIRGRCVFERATWEQRKCTWNVGGRARGEVLEELGYFSELRGNFDFDGELIWRPGSTGWRSAVRADELRLWGRHLADVSGVLVADRYAARLDLERARYADGTLEGDVEVDILDETRPLSVALSYDDLRLDDLLADQKIPVSGVASRLAGRLRYRCELRSAGSDQQTAETCRSGDGRGELFVTADPHYPDPRSLALEGAFPLRIEGGVVHADSLTLANSTQSALAAGWYDLKSDEGRWNYDVATSDVGELLPLLPLADPEIVPSWLPISGSGHLVGHLELGSGNPRTELTLRLENVETPRLVTERAVGSLTADTVGLWNLRLDLGNPDHALHVEGNAPFAETEPLHLTFDAFRWPMADVQPWLEDLPTLPLDGDISGRMELLLPHDSPSSGMLAATLEPAVLKTPGRPVPIDALATRLTWKDGTLDVRSLDLRSASGVISGAGSVVLPSDSRDGSEGQSGLLDLRLASPFLDLEEEPLSDYRTREDLNGILALEAHLGGDFRQPELELRLTSQRLRLADRPLPGTSRLDVVWDGRKLAAAAGLGNSLLIEGGGDLDLHSAQLDFALRADDLAALLTVLGWETGAAEDETPDRTIGGRVGGEIQVSGPWPDPEVRVVLNPLELRLVVPGRDDAPDDEPRSVELKAQDPVVVLCCTETDAEATGERALRIETAELVDSATDSRVALAGTVYDAFGMARADLELRAELDASWVRLLAVPELPVSGRLGVEGRLTGDPTAPDLSGVARLENGVFDVPGMPQAVTDLEGSLHADGRRLRIDQLRGRFAGGDVRLGGRMTLASPRERSAGVSATDSPSYRLTLEADHVDLRHPDGWSLAGDAELVMTSTASGAQVTGRADLRQLGWRQDLRFEVSELLRELFRRRRLEVSPADHVLSAIALNVQLSAPGAVLVDNNLAQMSGSADLFLRGDLATPVLYGEVAIDEGGTLVYNGVDYVVDRGRILFVDPYDSKAEIDLSATSRVRDFDVTLSAFGSLERLETRFSSDPPLPDVELFRLLAGGDVVETEAQLLDPRIARLSDEESTSAAGFLYGQAAAAIGDRVSGLFGLDKFRIDPLTGSDRDNLSKARITVGKRLSKDVFVTYSVDPSSNDNQRLQIEWRVAEGLTLVLTQNGDNSYSADARWDSTF